MCEHTFIGPRFTPTGINPYPGGTQHTNEFKRHLHAWCQRRENWPTEADREQLREADRVAQEACEADCMRQIQGDTENAADDGE